MHSRNPDAEELMWILLYIHADDISLVCDNSESLRAATLMDVTFVQWGLTISTKKTKVLVVGKDAAEQSTNAVITIRGEVLEVVSHSKYLGSMFTSDGMLDTEIAHRVAGAGNAFARLHQAKVWSSKALSLPAKLQFLQTIVMTMLLYGGETWSLLDKHLHQLSVFHMRCLRRICGISLLDHITNSVILKRGENFFAESQLISKRLRWFGHICRMSDSRLPKVLMHGQLVGQNCRGRPRTVWNDVVLFDIHKLKLNRYTHDALNRPVWRELTCVART